MPWLTRARNRLYRAADRLDQAIGGLYQALFAMREMHTKPLPPGWTYVYEPRDS